MQRETNIAVFIEISNNNLLSKSRLKVYQTLIELNKPSTAREIFYKMGVKPEATRLTELRNRGVIEELEPRICTITGRNVLQYWITNELPVEPIKTEKRPKGFKKSLSYMIRKMEHENLNYITIEVLKRFRDRI